MLCKGYRRMFEFERENEKMKKWNVFGLVAAAVFSCFAATTVLPQKTNAQEIRTQEELEIDPETTFDDFSSAGDYMVDQLCERNTCIIFTVVQDKELSDDELEETLELKWRGIRYDGWIASYKGAALLSDINDIECTIQVGTDGEKFYYVIQYDVIYITNRQQEMELRSAVSKTVADLCSGDLWQYEKIRNIYEYICGNVRFDDTHKDDDTYLLQDSAYAAMIQHTASSEGFAALFYRMCVEDGIPCQIVRGTANGEFHTWNLVRLAAGWYNVDATWDAYSNPILRNYQWFLKNNSDFPNHVSINALWNPDESAYQDPEYSFDVPEEDRCFVGLAYVDGIWYYYRNGGVDESFSGLVSYNGNRYYVENGKINWKYTGLVLDNGTWRFVRGGCLDESYTGLTQYYGTWYYVENGKLNWGYTGLVNYGGSWYAVENGRLNWNYNGLMLYKGAWYYISGGCLNWNYTGLTNYYGTWYYIYKGCLNWGYTGLTYYNHAWYYVANGVMNWGYTGLTLYNGSWYYVEGSIIRWNYTGLVEYYGSRYYVENSVINWGYSGSFVQDGVEYQIRYGTVVG